MKNNRWKEFMFSTDPHSANTLKNMSKFFESIKINQTKKSFIKFTTQLYQVAVHHFLRWMENVHFGFFFIVLLLHLLLLPFDVHLFCVCFVISSLFFIFFHHHKKVCTPDVVARPQMPVVHLILLERCRSTDEWTRTAPFKTVVEVVFFFFSSAFFSLL